MIRQDDNELAPKSIWTQTNGARDFLKISVYVFMYACIMAVKNNILISAINISV